MTTNVQQFLSAFDALTPPEKQQAVVEVLRRISGESSTELSDEGLTAIADGLFCAIDAEEADNART